MSKPQANNNLTDLELKDHGNKLFSARKFEDAISCYTKAIVSLIILNANVEYFQSFPSNFLEMKRTK